MRFPDTKYMGSKRAILPQIMRELAKIEFETVLDAFSGSACVSYELKRAGKQVVANDFLEFAHILARATIENDDARLDPRDIEKLLHPSEANDFIQRNFTGLYFNEEDCAFLDNVYANLIEVDSELKRCVALAALCRACMKKRPRGIFTFVGHKGWDGRRDLRMSMRDQFLEAVHVFNACVFGNGKRNKATRQDVFDTSPEGIDLVYIDTPYISPHSDCDYTRRYHFVEGLCSYWQDVEIQHNTTTKKIKSYPTAFCSIKTAEEAFTRLFDHFRNCCLAVSYSSNGVPSKERLVQLLNQFKGKVTVKEMPHRYCFGNQAHKVGNNNNQVTEYLFVAT